MADSVKLPDALVAELLAALNYLRLGDAEVTVKGKNVLALTTEGFEPCEISANALAYLARKNWIKRDGRCVQITDKAPSQYGSKADVKQTRPTEIIQLVEDGVSRNVTRVLNESPIDYLVSRKDKQGVPLLGSEEWAAGDRLRSDFTRANMLPGIGMRWGEPIRGSGGAGGGVTQTDAAMAARARISKALAAVGPEFSGLLLDVCCFLKGLEQVEMERGWPQRSAKLMLRAGLSILSRHYAPPKNTAVKTRSWSADSVRPSA